MFKRILIISASAGNGHVKAAEAEERAARAMFGESVEIKNVDALHYSSSMLRELYSKGYIHMVNKMPDALGILYDRMDTPWEGEKRRLAFHRMNTKPLVDLILDYKPDLCISTHFLGSEMISWLICKKRIETVNAIVVTDFDAHAMWFCRHYDRYFVALEQTRFVLGKHGIDPNLVTVSGIPIDPVFAQNKDKQEMRQKYGLDPGLPTILLSAGGFGVGPMEQITAELSSLTRSVQVVALCGKNSSLKERMQGLADSAPQSLHIVPVGYTDKMDEYMSAADILLGKTGGLTTSEALAKGLAFVIFNPIPGQEERNSDHLLENGIGIRCNDLPALSYKLDTLLVQPERLAAMQANTSRLAHPNSATTIIETLMASSEQHSGTLYAPGHKCYSRSNWLRKIA